MENVQLAKSRDLGQTIGDPFLFARHNFRFLLKGYLYYAVPPLLVAVTLVAFGMKNVFSNLDSLRSQYSPGHARGFGSGLAGLGTGIILAYLLFMLISFFQQLYISEYMVLKENKEDVSNDEVLARLKSDWKNIAVTFLFLILFAVVAVVLLFMVIGSSALFGPYISGLTVFILYLLLLYTLVPLSNLVFIRLRERLDIFSALVQAFRITFGHWWHTFVGFFITFIVFYSLVILFLIPFYFVVAILSYHAVSSGITPSVSSIYLNPVSGVILTLTTFATFFLQNIFTLFVGINYFSLSEKHSNFHLRFEINNIGEREDKSTHRQEGEY